MGFVRWVAVIAIVLLAVGLEVGVFFFGLARVVEIVGDKTKENPAAGTLPRTGRAHT